MKSSGTAKLYFLFTSWKKLLLSVSISRKSGDMISFCLLGSLIEMAGASMSSGDKLMASSSSCNKDSSFIVFGEVKLTAICVTTAIRKKLEASVNSTEGMLKRKGSHKLNIEMIFDADVSSGTSFFVSSMTNEIITVTINGSTTVGSNKYENARAKKLLDRTFFVLRDRPWRPNLREKCEMSSNPIPIADFDSS